MAPDLYRSIEPFLAAARPAMAGAPAAEPVALLVAELDPLGGLPIGERQPPGEACEIAQWIRSLVRADDVVACTDRAVFVLLPGVSALDGVAVGERLCAALRSHSLVHGPHAMTLSVGSAAAPEHGETYETVLSHALEALLAIQARGGDGAMAAVLPGHDVSRPLSIERCAGRAAELTSLVRWMDEAFAGQPRVVTVVGEAGSGTTTLLRQLDLEARLRGGRFAMGASPASGVAPPYGVWSTLLRALHRLQRAQHQRRAWRELQNLEATLASADPGIFADITAPTGSQYRLLAELTDYIRDAAAAQPLVLVLDEMHAADDTSWDALEHLLSRLDADRLLICLPMRQDARIDASRHRDMLARYEITRETSLARLTRDEVKQWLEAAFHRQPVGREFLAFLYRHTEGNPWFIAQTLRALVEEGAIWRDGTRWSWSPVSELQLPACRRELIAHRLGRFSSSTHAVLDTAAIVGREFDVGLLVGAGAGSEPAVRLAISEAVDAALVRATHERGGGRFVFVHDEIAQVLRESIPRERERQLHARVACELERRDPDRALETALHFDVAGEQPDAYRTAQLAAKSADRLHAHGAASAYLRVAARNATTPAELAEVRVALAHVAELGGRFDEVEELCDLAIEWLAGQSDGRRALTLRRMRERARVELGQPATRTLDAMRELDAEAERLAFDRERVAILLATSQAHGRLGDQRAAERIAADGVEMARNIGDAGLLGDALIRLGNVLLNETPSRARAIYAQALDLAEGIGDARRQALTLGNLGVAAQFESRLEDAIEAYGRAITVARSEGMPDLSGLAALNLGVLWQRCGDYDRARDLFGEALGLFAEVKHSEYQLAALFNLGHVERELGLWESAASLYEATIPLAQRIGQADIEIGATAGAGLCALELRQDDAARRAGDAARARMGDRSDWFQGREVVEALLVRIDALEQRRGDALSRFATAVEMAEASNVYSAAWLTAACAGTLLDADPAATRSWVERYSARVKGLGYPELTRRYDAIASLVTRRTAVDGASGLA